MSNSIYFSPVGITKILTENSIKKAAKRYATGKLVDLGCGEKPYESIISPYITSYFGVDFQPTAEVNYGKGTKADLYRDCTDTGLPDESFDTLISTQVMEHVFDTAKYLAECHRLLKPGGAGIFTVPLMWPCHAEPYDYFRFTRYSLEKLFEGNGFQIEEMHGVGLAFAAASQIFLLSIFGKNDRITAKIMRRLALFTIVPLITALALAIDKVQRDGPLCLNYMVVVRKPKSAATI